jgi:hypothetical protein
MSGRSAADPQAPHIAPSGKLHMQHPRRARPLMQVVDILRDDQQSAAPRFVQPRQRTMRGIGLDRRQRRPTEIVEAVHQLRIRGECLGGTDVLDPVTFP